MTKIKTRKAAISFSAATLVVMVIGVVSLVLGLLFLQGIIRISPFEKPAPYFLLKTEVFPSEGREGTFFTIRFYSATNFTYLVRAEIFKKENGKKVASIRLYDDGSHGDMLAKDGIYANIWDSAGQKKEYYHVNIVLELIEGSESYEHAAEFQIYETNCINLIYNGDDDEKIDVVFLSHGYEDMKKFKKDVFEYIDYKGQQNGLFSVSPLKENKEKFNFYIVNQSLDLGCKLGCKGIASMVCCDDNKVIEIASQCPSDQIIVLLDKKEFCGTASFYAKVCTYGGVSKDVLLHEFGHSFAGLGDEYDYGMTYPSLKIAKMEFPNCAEKGCEKWEGIVKGAGCFKSCGWSDFYRPTKKDCIMYHYVHKFCPVCSTHLSNLLKKYEKTNESIKTRIKTMPAPPLKKSYLLGLKKEQEKLDFENVFVTPAPAPDRKILRREDYSAELISFENKTLYEFAFEMPNILFPMYNPASNSINDNNASKHSAIFLENFTHTIVVPYFENAELLEIYEKNKTILTIDLAYFSKMCGDGICQKHENYFECPQDCPLAAPDNICSYIKDGICDPDCPDIDPDCRTGLRTFGLVLIITAGLIILVVLIIVIISAKTKKKK